MGERAYAPCAGPEGPFCPTLDRRVAALVNERRAGLVIIEVTSFKTGEHRVVGVAHKTKPSDVGLMLNHCPWCGADIAPRERGRNG